jgi:hypothetical protein
MIFYKRQQVLQDSFIESYILGKNYIYVLLLIELR